MSEDPFVRQAAVLRWVTTVIGVVNGLKVDVVGANTTAVAAAVAAEGFRDQAAVITGLTGEDTAVAFLVGQTSSATTAALDEYTADVVRSPLLTRLIAVEEDQPLPPVQEGDLIVRYRRPGDSYFTDFSGDTVGQPPAGWSTFAVATTWHVVSEAGAQGGKALSLVDAANFTRRGLSWDAINADTERADVEILWRWKNAHATGATGVQAIARATANIDTVGAGMAGGVLDESRLRPMKYEGGAYVSGSFVTKTGTLGSWYLTRLRLEGDTAKLKQWAADAIEPAAWDTTMAVGGVTAPGLVGIFATRGTPHPIDWVAVGTGGRTAVKP